MSEMIVQVRNKILRRIGGVNHFVSHNKDYTIQFQFDESWDNVRTKMAVFAYEDGEYGSEIFDGDTCNVPEFPREGRILIGVKAGEDLSTELLCIPVCKSADDVITDEYNEPDPKIYEQILDIINNLWNGGTTVYPSPVKFLASPSTAKVGDLIRVKEVDENGDVTRTEGFDVGVELEKKIDAPQVAKVGEVLTVEEIGEDGKPKKWKTAAVDPKSIKDMYYEGFDAIDTWIHDPDNQHISENNITLSAGEQCTVRIGDDEYKVVAENQQTGRYDYSMVLGTWDFSSVPFYFTIASEYGAEVAFGKLYTRLSDSVTAGTKISLEKNFAHTIKEKYFPKTIFTQENAPVRFGDILKNSAVQGKETVASGQASHAEGYQTTASGDNSHAEGNDTNASGFAAHAEGSHTVASNIYSHAEGIDTKATGPYSHAEGESTVASSTDQHVQGRRNIKDENDKYAHIVGNGNSTKASNAYTLDWEGNAWFAGDVYVHSTSGTNKDDGSVRLVTEDQLTFCDRVVIRPTKNDDGTITYSASFPALVIYHKIFKGRPTNAGNSVECCLMPIDPNGPLTVLSYTGMSVVQNSDGNIVLTIRFSSYTSGKQISAEIKDTISGFGTDNENRLSTVVTVTENAYLPTPTTAQPGQIVKVKSVDEYGKITETEAVDMPTVSDDYELVFQETVAEDVGAYSRDTDKDGNPFSLTDVMVIIFTKPFAESTNSGGRGLGFLPTSTWGKGCVSCDIGSSISSANTNLVGRYNVVFVKVVNGYQVVMRAYKSQNESNVFGTLMRQTAAGNEMFGFHTDATKLMQLNTPQGNITCVKIVGYTNPLVSAGTIVALYKKKGT